MPGNEPPLQPELEGGPTWRRLGRNRGRYAGESIDIFEVLAQCQRSARNNGFATEFPLAQPGLELAAFHRPPAAALPSPCRIYISAGIHGDEPAGVLALQRLLATNAWPPEIELWICPCLNPTGFVHNRRENAAGIDLNRHYLKPHAQEIVAHTRWLLAQPRFDLSLCLHEDWEAHGFYLYELNPDGLPSLAPEILRRVTPVCPIDPSELIEGRHAKGGVIVPTPEQLLRPDWPEALFLIHHKTRLSYTLEAPSDFPLAQRVAALEEATLGALEALLRAARLT